MSGCTCIAPMIGLDCPVHGDHARRLVVEAIDDDQLIQAQPPGRCALCSAVEETRPYGPNGEHVCFACAMQDEPAMRRGFECRLAVPTTPTEET